jgi:hypothetical protein
LATGNTEIGGFTGPADLIKRNPTFFWTTGGVVLWFPAVSLTTEFAFVAKTGPRFVSIAPPTVWTELLVPFNLDPESKKTGLAHR